MDWVSKLRKFRTCTTFLGIKVSNTSDLPTWTHIPEVYEILSHFRNVLGILLYCIFGYKLLFVSSHKWLEKSWNGNPVDGIYCRNAV